MALAPDGQPDCERFPALVICLPAGPVAEGFITLYLAHSLKFTLRLPAGNLRLLLALARARQNDLARGRAAALAGWRRPEVVAGLTAADGPPLPPAALHRAVTQLQRQVDRRLEDRCAPVPLVARDRLRGLRLAVPQHRIVYLPATVPASVRGTP